MTTECAEALSLMTRDTCAGVVVPDFRAATISGAVLFQSRVHRHELLQHRLLLFYPFAQRLPDENVISGAKQEHYRCQ